MDISNISVLVFIFLFTFMLLGLEVYAYRVKFNTDHKLDLSDEGIYPRSNFNTPINALLSVFIVLANDGWSEIYSNHARATDFISSTVFFIVILILGQFILLNLLIAIMIENFEQLSVRNDLTNKLNQIKQTVPFKQKLKKFFCEFKKQKVKPMAKSVTIMSEEEIEEEIEMKDMLLR